ncbi:MAG: hypothetical protein BWY87_01227 [Deltaproteobacteria bacterium ADurb.Bin510]|nr:MAG: hypothetical protein BWY87_01227 [Deltaproteobacteria bacterium ADurb.Bin510]
MIHHTRLDPLQVLVGLLVLRLVEHHAGIQVVGLGLHTHALTVNQPLEETLGRGVVLGQNQQLDQPVLGADAGLGGAVAAVGLQAFVLDLGGLVVLLVAVDVALGQQHLGRNLGVKLVLAQQDREGHLQRRVEQLLLAHLLDRPRDIALVERLPHLRQHLQLAAGQLPGLAFVAQRQVEGGHLQVVRGVALVNSDEAGHLLRRLGAQDGQLLRHRVAGLMDVLDGLDVGKGDLEGGGVLGRLRQRRHPVVERGLPVADDVEDAGLVVERARRLVPLLALEQLGGA